MNIDTFQINDKVVCVDDSPDVGPLGKFKNVPIQIGMIYNVFAVFEYNIRGEVLHVFADDYGSGWEKKHFKLIKR